ncbi:pyridoxal phosphate-dependent decarboxylase family protein [Silvanigrella aquatica]|uniref:Aspartate aminotransferase family protein n=1 Tax=Silvanigrella aquatica TaxID=1915309 RepID=A0A1L4D4G8_9BACT|nr:pyridoxal-dependent decarboxylase [Silvanigrella aquatica]APJ05089.1 hypothetical protein AXG55_04750 [Silvanigrella aquatica]
MVTHNLTDSINLVSDWIGYYNENIHKLSVLPKVEFGEILNQLPKNPEEFPEDFKKIFEDFKTIILPGITHWQHPKFFAYFPSNTSPPSLLAEMVICALGVQGMSWVTSPAATELEICVMDWLRKMIGLPSCFTGVIQDSASSSTMIAMTVAREKISNFTTNKTGIQDLKLVAYCSVDAHSSVEKSAKIIGIGSDNLRKIPINQKQQMDIEILKRTIEDDIKNGFKPFFIVGTFGTTSSASIDPLQEIAQLSKNYGIWFHVDAAYAGSALILPEIREMAIGICEADSIVFNPHKWLFTSFECSAFFIRNKNELLNTFEILPEYLKTNDSKAVVNFRDWGLGLGRKFRSLKLWFVIRWYGIQGLQNMIRSHIEYAKKLENIIKEDNRFEFMANRYFALICFRLKGSDELNYKFMDKINKSGKLYLSHTKLNEKFVLRLSLGQTNLTEKNVIEAWQDILSLVD